MGAEDGAIQFSLHFSLGKAKGTWMPLEFMPLGIEYIKVERVCGVCTHWGYGIYYHVVIDALQFIESNSSFIQVIYSYKLDKIRRRATKMIERMKEGPNIWGEIKRMQRV